MKINPVNVNPVVVPKHHPVVSKAPTESRGESGVSNVSNTSDLTEEAVRTSSMDGTSEDVVQGIDPNEEDQLLTKSVDQANQTLKMYDRKLEMSVHEVTKTIMYKLMDTKTNEVIMEFPPKKIQDMIAKMWELAGLFVDKKA